MPTNPTTQSVRIPLVRGKAGGRSIQGDNGRIVVAYAVADARDADYLGQFIWMSFRNRKLHYASRNFWDGEKNLKLLMHRVVWERHFGPYQIGLTVDHKNRDGLDNRLENLRLATVLDQARNKSPREESTTGYKGVFPSNGGRNFAVEIGITRDEGYLRLFLGRYRIAVEGAYCYNVAAKLLYGDFAWLNPVPDGAVSEQRATEIAAYVRRRLVLKSLIDS